MADDMRTSRIMQGESTTLQPKASGVGTDDRDRRVPALTILSHPLPSRIGQQARLSPLAAGGTVGLSRREPDFVPPDSLWGREPLEDPFLSRKPWRLEARPGGGLFLRRAGSTMELWIDGELIAEQLELDAKRLDAGVVLELSGRVALWLHRLPDRPPKRGPRDSSMVGESEALASVSEAIDRVGPLDVPVLLRGETGTGKELVAAALHRCSRRTARPFVAVNLAALPPSLAPAELFGNVKGAFTGAAQARAGLFRAADGGTLFLDEVGETSGEVQAMLLRVLETKRVMAVGSHTESAVDVRLIAATDSQLEQRAEQGDFRAPLLHRLAAYEIWLPPLRARREDLGRLVLHFARQAEREVGRPGWLDSRDATSPPWMPSRVMARLALYHWPGNVRQLRNVVSQLMIDAQGQDSLQLGPRLEHLLSSEPPAGNRQDADDKVDSEGGGRPNRTPTDVTPDQLEAAMREQRFEPAAAARHLGISRPSIYKLIREHPKLRTAEDLDAEDIRLALDQAEGVVREAARSLEVSVRALGRRMSRDGL